MPHRRTSRPNKRTGLQLKAQRILSKLRHYYKQGGLTDLSKRGATAALAEASGVGVSTAHKARAFARQYTPRELDALCKLRRPDGLPLNWGYVPYLLTVPWRSAADKAVRAHLEKEAAAKGWTSPKLYSEIKRRFPHARRKTSGGVGGQPRKGAVGSTEYLQALIADAEAFGRGIENLGEAKHRSKRAARQLKSRLSTLEEAVKRLRKQVSSVKRGLN